jgi:hypothetical protein
MLPPLPCPPPSLRQHLVTDHVCAALLVCQVVRMGRNGRARIERCDAFSGASLHDLNQEQLLVRQVRGEGCCAAIAAGPMQSSLNRCGGRVSALCVKLVGRLLQVCAVSCLATVNVSLKCIDYCCCHRGAAPDTQASNRLGAHDTLAGG